MGIYDDLGLNKDVARNDFTKEEAVKVFEKAIEELNSGSAAAETVEKILDAGFDILKIAALFA
jgi:exonuclease VII small subunit